MNRTRPSRPSRPCPHIFAALSVALAATAPSHAQPAATRYLDPAPPVVHPLDDRKVPGPQPHPRVTFHQKPRPVSPEAVTHDWPSFLGPTHNAHASETRLLKNWPDAGPTLLWEMKKGTSYTAPAILGDRLAFFHRVGDEEIIECLNRETGELYWQHAYTTRYRDRYGYNNGPRASPVIDGVQAPGNTPNASAEHGSRVYTYGAEGKLTCLALATGQVLWQRDLKREFGSDPTFFGVGSTPLIEGDLIIINIGAPGFASKGEAGATVAKGATVAAFDKHSGKLLWHAGDQWGASYASPVPATVHGRRRLFLFAGADSNPPTGGLIMLDPATGEIDFEFPWRSESYESVNASSPVVIQRGEVNEVFITASYQAGSALLTITPDMRHKIAWTTQHVGAHWNTFVHDAGDGGAGYLYGFDGRNPPDAALVCVDARSGDVVWRDELKWMEKVELRGGTIDRNMSTFRGCLLKVDGAYLCLGETGHLLWLDLSPRGCKVLARARLFYAQETWALPVLSRGLVYITQNARDMLDGAPPRLLCYELRGE